VNTINEWEFTADVAGWINVLLQNSRLPFSAAKCEQRGSGDFKSQQETFVFAKTLNVTKSDADFVRVGFAPDAKR